MSASGPGPQTSKTHYVIVRRDLPLGFLAAQVVHAAGESADGPVPVGTNAVVLAVPDEPALVDLTSRLAGRSIPHVLVREPDAPWNGQATAIGITPVVDRAPLRALLCSLPLLGKSAGCVECIQTVGGICYTCRGGLSRRHKEAAPTT